MLGHASYFRLLHSPLLVAALLQMQAIARSHDACLVQISRNTGDEEAEEYTHQDGHVRSSVVPTLKLPWGPPPKFTEIGRMSVRSSGRSSSSSNSSSVVTVASPFSNISTIKHHPNLWQYLKGHFWWHLVATDKPVRSQISAALMTTIGNGTLPDGWLLFFAICSSLAVFVCLPLTVYPFSVYMGACPNNSSCLSEGLLESRMPSGYTSPKQKEFLICPELCVPKDKECKLLFPVTFEANSKACIRNSQNAVVLSASLSSSTEHGDLRISLFSPDERRCFASCQQLEPGVLRIHDAQASKPAVELRRDTWKGGFLLDTSCGSRLLLNYQMQNRTMEVIDDDRVIAVAVTDSNTGLGELEICVGPGGDVSLIVLAVLGIELFLEEGKCERQSSMPSRTPSRLST